MIISKKYAKSLIKQGKAVELGKTTTATRWEDNSQGKTYVIITRFDNQRTDHFLEN